MKRSFKTTDEQRSYEEGYREGLAGAAVFIPQSQSAWQEVLNRAKLIGVLEGLEDRLRGAKP